MLPFPASREGKRRGLLWKTLAGVSVGVPVAAGLQYAVSAPRERRKMRIVVEGFGRLCRFVLHALIWTLKRPLAFIPCSPEHIPSQLPTLLTSCLCVLRSLSVGIFISVDYWWTTNMALRGLDEVSSFRKTKLGNTIQ